MTNIIDVQESRDTAIYRGTEFCMAEISMAERDLANQRAALENAVTNLAAAFRARDMEQIKEKSDVAVKAAAAVERTSSQIKILSQSLSETFAVHCQRRGKV